MQFKYSSDRQEELRTIGLRKQSKLSEVKALLLEPLYKEPIKLSFEKFNDFQDLIVFVPSHLKHFLLVSPMKEEAENVMLNPSRMKILTSSVALLTDSIKYVTYYLDNVIVP